MSFQAINPNFFQVEGDLGTRNATRAVSIRCPHCRQLGSFINVGPDITYAKNGTKSNVKCIASASASLRICPNDKCRGLVFIVECHGEIVEVEPPELLDSDPDGLPANLQKTLQEAISCHAAGAYRATAMMVRRLLEEICDLNNAEGANLHQRLESLKVKVVLPQALFEAMSELKALGNDAAHIEANAYDKIGKDEAADSIELAKEILKALYQLQGLLSRLQARKNSGSPVT
jgi:hypothetical protein